MLNPETIEQVKGLLHLTNRDIAKEVGVSRESVRRIRLGRIQIKPVVPKPPKPKDPYAFRDDFERCPGCGGMVLMPCIWCEQRKRRE